MYTHVFNSKVDTLLSEKLLLQPETLKEKLLVNYQVWLLQNLKTAMEEGSSLEKVLAQNWDLVKGTYLSYTAHHQSEVTRLLCDIAVAIAHEKQVSALKILMPSIHTESLSDAYPDLECQTAEELIHILSAHITNQSNTYLIPVHVLSELKIPQKDIAKLPNYYFDYSTMASEQAYINPKELICLFNHSLATQELLDAKTNYENLVIDQSHLLGRLNELIRNLRFNSSSRGVGTEELAGEGVYNAIVCFNHYYHSMSEQQLDKIPYSVKAELDKILKITSDTKDNERATRIAGTCVGLLSDNLNKVVKRYEATLCHIGVDDSTKEKLLMQAKLAFEKCKSNLTEQINRCDYLNGFDNLGITNKLLDKFQVPCKISSNADFEDFLSLSAAEIKNIVQDNPAIRRAIVEQLSTIDSFVTFVLLRDLERVKAVLMVIGSDIANQIVEMPGDISKSLILLEGERFDIVVDMFKPKLIDIVTSVQILCEVFENLSDGQRVVIFNVMRSKLTEIISFAYEFRLLKYLNEEQGTLFFNDVKPKLSELIHTEYEFCIIVSYLSNSQKAAALESTINKLHKITLDGKGLSRILEHLTSEQRGFVLSIFENKLSSMFNDGFDIGVFKYLNPDQCQRVLLAIEHKLWQIVRGALDFYKCLEFLSEPHRNMVFQSVIQKLPMIINSGSDLSTVCLYLNEWQTLRVLNAIKLKLPQFINNRDDCRNLMLTLNTAQCKMLLDNIPGILPELNLDPEDIRYIIDRLNNEKRMSFISAIYKTRILDDSAYSILNKYFPQFMRKKAQNIDLKKQAPSQIYVGANVGIILYLFGFTLLFSTVLAIASTAGLLLKKYYEQYQFRQKSYPLFFQSKLAEFYPSNTVDENIKAYRLGEEAGNSWYGYIKSYQDPSAYWYYSAFCTGKNEAEQANKGHTVSPNKRFTT